MIYFDLSFISQINGQSKTFNFFLFFPDTSGISFGRYDIFLISLSFGNLPINDLIKDSALSNPFTL